MWLWESGRFRLVNQTQARLTTPADAVLASKVGSCLAPHFESKLTEGFLQPFRALRLRMAEIGESFHEELLSTGALLTAQTTARHDETEGMPTRGKIT